MFEDELTFNFTSAEDLKEIQWLLSTHGQSTNVGTPFNSNILRLALNLKEELVASILVAKYQVVIDEKMMIRAIKTEQFNFMYFVYAYNKNYEQLADQDEDEIDHDPDEGEFNRHKTFTYDWLIKQILAHKEDNADNLIREFCKWELHSNENIL